VLVDGPSPLTQTMRRVFYGRLELTLSDLLPAHYQRCCCQARGMMLIRGLYTMVASVRLLLMRERAMIVRFEGWLKLDAK